MDEPDRRKIAVVGPCASGKSTLVKRLNDAGFHAYTVAQEHSAVRSLWRNQHPDVLIALEVSLEAVRERRSPTWLEAVYLEQQRRLSAAYAAADLVVDTSVQDADHVEKLVRAFLAESR